MMITFFCRSPFDQRKPFLLPSVPIFFKLTVGKCLLETSFFLCNLTLFLCPANVQNLLKSESKYYYCLIGKMVLFETCMSIFFSSSFVFQSNNQLLDFFIGRSFIGISQPTIFDVHINIFILQKHLCHLQVIIKSC